MIGGSARSASPLDHERLGDMSRKFIDAWTVTAAAAVLLAIAWGSRASFGLFFSPLNTTTGLGMATISLAGAVSQLGSGIAQPLVGAAGDRFGTPRVIVVGGLLTAAVTALVTVVDSAAGLMFAFLLLAVGGTAVGSNALLLAAVSRDASPQHRGLALGIVGAGGSAGQLIVAPSVQATIATAGWIPAMYVLAALALLALPLSRAFDQRPESSGVAPPAPVEVRDAWVDPNFWLICGGFFVCGFHVSFLLAHMPGQIELCGLPASLSGQWIAVVGACNVIGSLAAGAAIERVSMKHLLASLYALRALGVALFLAAPKNEATMLVFAVWMGLTYMATLAPTSGLVGKLFGTHRLATLFGVVMLLHQVGAFLGVWLGGVALEATGSLDWIWYADIALAVIAVALHLPIREDPSAPRTNASVVVVGPRSATAGS